MPVIHTFGMHLRHTVLDISNCLHTAGIICFSVEPTSHKVWFLLGQEATGQNWCDFGGRINPYENELDAAAREFAEESMCVLRLAPSTKDYIDYVSDVTTALENKEYVMKISIIHRLYNVRKVYYLKEFPWQPRARHTFGKIRDLMVGLRNDPTIPIPEHLHQHPGFVRDKDGIKINKHFLEKCTIGWWELNTIRRAISSGQTGPFRRSFLPALRIAIKNLRRYGSR